MPKIVADKFDTAPGIIQDLVKNHLMLLEETQGTSTTIPAGIIRLLNGKACRGFFSSFPSFYFVLIFLFSPLPTKNK
jgi:hypothetical protein